MTVQTLARIVGNHLQNVAMLSGLDVAWPDSFRNLFTWTQVFNIDLSRILISLRLPTFTQRLIFIIVSIGVPLSLMLLTALVFFSISSIVQISLFICSVTLLIVHTISFADSTILPAVYNESVSSLVSLWFAWAGVMTLLLYRIVRMKKYDIASVILWSGTVLWGVTITGIPLLPKRVVLAIFTIVILAFWLLRLERKYRAIAIVWTLILAGVVIWLVEKWEVKLPPQLRILGWVLFGLGSLAALSRVVSLLSSGGNSVIGFFSKTRAKLSRLLDTGLLTAILFLMSMVYSPVITNAMQLFVCQDYQCPPGYAFNPYADRPEDDPYTTSSEVFCEMCNFTSQCGFSTYDLCPGFKSRRLLYDPATTCDNKSYMSFIIASCLVLFVFVVILQVMYVKVIDACTKVMAVKTKAGHQRMVAQFQEDMISTELAKEVEAPPTFGEQWEDVCLRVSPKASSLYDAFRFGLRYFILIESFYKTVEVLSTTFLSPLSPAATVLALMAHTAFFFVLVLLRPFADKTEQWLSVLLSLCMVLSTLYSVLVWQSPAQFSQPGWAIAVLIVNVVIPCGGGAYLMYATVKNQFCHAKTLVQQRQEAEQREIQEKLKQNKELEKKLTKKEIMLKRHIERQRKIQEEMDRFEQAYATNGEGELDDPETLKKKQKTSKDLKREQMTPSQKLAEYLNNFTKKIILLYFAFLAIPLLCVALVLTLISGDISGNTEFVDASNFFDRTRQTVLNNYFSWDEFSSSCCCFETEKFSNHGSNNVTERWICMNFGNLSSRENATTGASFFRTRIDNAGNDGMAIRPMCALQLVQECSPEINGDDTVQMRCENDYVKAMNITDYALAILW